MVYSYPSLRALIGVAHDCNAYISAALTDPKTALTNETDSLCWLPGARDEML